MRWTHTLHGWKTSEVITDLCIFLASELTQSQGRRARFHVSCRDVELRAVDSATIVWTLLLGSCIALTAFATLIWKRPVTAALCVAGLVNCVVICLIYGEGPLWGLAMILVLICTVPLTVVTGIVTDNLIDKYADWRDHRQGRADQQ
jgi:hypothetical protein